MHHKIANQRKDFLHKQSKMIADDYDIVAIENLNMRLVSNKNFGNGKSTMDNGYGMFAVMLDYKLSLQGKRLIKVDRYFPSSQLCSVCGYKNMIVKDLHIRRWTCPNCGSLHDRDENAAINIKNEAIRILMAS